MSKQHTAVDVTKESSVALHTPGSLHVDELGNHYRYLQANGAKVANNLYSWHPSTGTGSTSYQVEDIADAGVTPADGELVPVCCPQIAMTDNYYAWVFVGPGDCTATSGDAVAVDTKLYVHATAGAFTDGATAALLRGCSVPVAFGSATTGVLHAAHEMYAEDLP